MPARNECRHPIAYRRACTQSLPYNNLTFFLTYLILIMRRRRFWHATHDCVAPYVDRFGSEPPSVEDDVTSSSTEGGSEPNLLLRGA